MRYLRLMTPLLIFGCVIETLEETFCPEDSELTGSGECKCRPTCPPPPSNDCFYKTSTASIGTPGNCCPRYECNIPAGGNRDACPEDSIPIENGGCKCLPTCPPHKCHSGLRPVLIREALPETPGSCCPLYDCKPSESISWVGPEDGQDPRICIHEGVSRKPNEKWQDSPCINCSCDEEGRVSCQETMCKSCENPIPPEAGECCPHCPMPPPPQMNTTYHELPPSSPPCRFDARECKLNCPYGYVRDEHDCLTCQCIQPKNIETNNDSDCLELSHCDFNCILTKDERGCPVCDCQSTSIIPSHETNKDKGEEDKPTKSCPKVQCDLHCERGLAMDENDCTLCECKTSECPPLTGCRKRCNYGYKTNKRGCPICRCRAVCTDDLNITHPEGQTWHPNSCKTCTCETGGKLNCQETVCSLACTDPLPPKPNTCCPVCPIMHNKGTNHTTHQHQTSRGWGTIPITLIVVLTFLCLLLIAHIVRSRFRGRLSPSETAYSSYPPQYYKCVPAYDTPMHHNEKIVRL